MSELKAYYVPTRSGNSCHCYIKSEADKVIAELKAQKAQAEDDCAYWKTMSRKCADDNEVMAKQRAETFRRESHHKYKRCLAMADKCADRRMYWTYRLQDDGDKGYSKDYKFKKNCFWRKWCVRWLELAEKFKEAK